MGRSPCCVKEGLNRGAWTAMEDQILSDYVKLHGEGSWRNLPKRAGLKRCGKSCRLRWLNYLRPDIKRGNISPDEEELIVRLHKLLGNRWSLIAGRLPGRTDNEIKNYWNTNLSKRVNQNCKENATTTKHQQNKSPLNHKKKKETTPYTELARSNIVRTKAMRCTKVFINPPDPAPTTTDNVGWQPYPIGDGMVDRNCSTVTSMVENSESELMMMTKNLDVGDFSLISDLLDSDLSNIFNYDNDENYTTDINNSSNELSPNSTEYEPLVFSQEMLEDWLGDHQL